MHSNKRNQRKISPYGGRPNLSWSLKPAARQRKQNTVSKPNAFGSTTAHRKTFKGREARPENPEKGQIFPLAYGSSTCKYATEVLYCFESSFSQSIHIYSAFINKEACDTLHTFDTKAGFLMTSLLQIVGQKITAITVVFHDFQTWGLNKQGEKPNEKCCVSFTTLKKKKNLFIPLLSIGLAIFLCSSHL